MEKELDVNWLGIAGRTCVVTGAASGIGAAIAVNAAQAGAKVALLDRDIARCASLANELKRDGMTAISVACDSADEKATLKMADFVEGALGPCSLLVNNAGIQRVGLLESVPIEDWNRVLAVNLTGYLLVARALLPQMRSVGHGSIVHIASISGNFPQPNSSAYSASKAGVMLLSRQMAVEWSASHIRSNVICPGMTRTALSSEFYAVPGVEAARAAATASGRVAEPQDMANTALFLLSDRSDYINAAEIAVDGGLSSVLMDMVPRPGFNGRVPAPRL